MSEPKRIQRQRTKGWRMPEGAVYVGRPTRWGNPFVTVEDGGAKWGGRDWHVEGPPFDEDGRPTFRFAELDRRPIVGRVAAERHRKRRAIKVSVSLFADLMWNANMADDFWALLVGRDLACWCPLDQPCHADVLLEIANATTEPPQAVRGGRGEGRA